MAELKVDKILPATGSSISLSESGKTVLIPSGATLDASAATLTNIGDKINYCTSLKTSPFTASASRGYFINTGSAVTVTLPSSPNVGDQIVVIDATGNASSNNITLGRNTNKIKGVCTDALLETDRVGVRIIYSGSSQGWVTVTSANETAPVLNTAQYISATGGTVITCGDFKIHKFASDATFCVSNAGNSCGSNTVDYLVVAGGGGGGGRCNTVGGGGAGGFRIGAVSAPCSAPPLVAPTGLPVSVQGYPITVGGGGLGGNVPPNPSVFNGAPGSNSVFSSITSTGGGGGGSGTSPDYKDGGSGGGGADTSPGGAGNTPPVSPPQGNPGGPGTPIPSGRAPAYAGGGGGGAGCSGVAGAPTKAGNGGDGSPVTAIFGASPQPFYEPTNGLYSGGGGGGFYTGCGAPPATQGLGGPGGGGPGGASVNTPGTAGTTNTGGGGGGATDTSPYDQSGGNGGSGVVLIRYKFQN